MNSKAFAWRFPKVEIPGITGASSLDRYPGLFIGVFGPFQSA
jgi:hypothetical protein